MQVDKPAIESKTDKTFFEQTEESGQRFICSFPFYMLIWPAFIGQAQKIIDTCFIEFCQFDKGKTWDIKTAAFIT